MKKHFVFQLLILIFSAVLGPQPSLGSDFHSPRTAALGGAGHAGPLLNDSIFLNPSFGSFFPTYSAGVNWLSYSHGPNNGGRNYSVSLLDGRNELFQAGAAYTVRNDASFIHLGASKSFLNRLGFGLSGKFFFINGRDRSAGRDLVFSATGMALPWLQLSLVVDNIFQTETGQKINLYREFILGTKFNVQGIVLVYFDPHYTPSLPQGGKYGHELGLEFVMMSDLFFRLGQFTNAMVPYLSSYGRGYGIGLGWVAPRISLDYGLSRAIEPLATTAHAFSATIYF